MERPRVLVAEDRRSVLKLMLAILGGSHDVCAAEDGRAALARLEAQDLDLVLTDVRLPGASGFEVLERARMLGPRTQVVLMTAYASFPDAVAAIKAGAYDYLPKPVDADEIALVVARALACARGASPAGERAEIPPVEPLLGLGFHGTVEEARRRVSREYLLALMRRYRGNVTQAALQARMTRESLHRVLRKYEVCPDSHRDGRDEAAPAGADSEPGRAHGSA